MEQQDQRPGSNDEQTVISAMRLLARNLPATQREKVFSILAREQEEYTQSTPMEHQSDEVPGAESLVYPVQPLMLGSDEGHAASSEHVTDAPMDERHAEEVPHEVHQDAGTERRYDGRIPFVPLLLPLAASFSPRQWLGRFIVIALFLCALSLSTLAAYSAGLRTTPAATPVPSANSSCYVIVRGHMFFGNRFSDRIVVIDRSSPQIIGTDMDDDDGPVMSTWVIYQGGFPQCGGMYHRGFDRPFSH